MSNKKKYLLLSFFSVFLLVMWMFVLQPRIATNYHSLDMHYAVSGNVDFVTSFIHLLKNIFSFRRIAYVILVYLPSGFLAFFSPSLFISTLADISYTITAQKGYMTIIYFGYQLNTSTIIYIASVVGIINISKFKPLIKCLSYKYLVIILSSYIFFSSLISNIIFYNIIDRSFLFRPFSSFKEAIISRNELVKESNILLKLVEEDVFLAAANNFFHNNNVLHRKNIRVFMPPFFSDSDYLLLNKNMRLNHIYKPQNEEYGLKLINEFLKNYEIIDSTENYVLYKKIEE